MMSSPAIPSRHESYAMPMTALRKCHPHLYGKPHESRKQLLWEKLWSTTSSEYGAHSNVTSCQHTSQKRGDVWQKHGCDTTADEIGEQHGNARLSGRVSPQISPDILKVDKPVSPEKAQISGLKWDTNRPIPRSNPKPHVLTLPAHHSTVPMDISRIDRSRPNLTSGYAKQYVGGTEGPFWSNLQTLKP